MSEDGLDANVRRDARDAPAANCGSAAPGANGDSAAAPLLAVVDDDEAVRRSMHRVLHAAGYLTKPVDPTPLLQAIAVAIGGPESAGTPAAKKTLTSPG
jgi:FixJ family two-component response regulator